MNTKSRSFIYWGAVFLLLGAALFSLKPGAIWITDNGNKYMMMRNFAQSGSLDPAISHPLPELFPTGGFHFIKTPQGVRSFYPEYLSIFTSPFYKFFGERAALIIPVCATLLLLFLAWHFWHIPPPLLLVSTPLLFYSLLLWEMTPSVCLVTAVLLLVQKKHFPAAGAVLGISLLMREEAYFVCAAMGGAMIFCRKWKECLKFGWGFLIPAGLIWTLQLSLHGHILGAHGKYYYLNNNADFTLLSQGKAAFFNYYHHLFRFDGWENPKLNLLVWSVLPLIGAGAAPGFKRWLNFKHLACVIYLGAMLCLAAGVFFHKNTIYSSSMLTGFLTATPVITGFTVNWYSFLRSRKFRLLTLFLLLYIVSVPPLMTANDVGLVWGARHFLVLLPCLVFLSTHGFRLMGIPKITLKRFSLKQLLFPCAIILSVFIQGYGIFALHRVSGESYKVEARLLAQPRKVIVTDLFYIPEQMPRLFFEKTVLQVITSKDLKSALKFLKEKQERDFLLILSPQFRRMNDTVLKELLTAAPLSAPPLRMTGAGGFPDLFAAKCTLRP